MRFLWEQGEYLKSMASMVLISFLLIAGCSTSPKKVGRFDEGVVLPFEDQESIVNLTNPILPKSESIHQPSLRNYTVLGKKYYPLQANDSYKEEGIASWYGKQFHGLKTAMGETFDMNALSAAHRTLPLPSYVRVTNLKNNKNIVLRVNDRGPFHPDRIIDLSYAAARKLGINSLGKVRVERIFPGDKASEIDSVEIEEPPTLFDLEKDDMALPPIISPPIRTGKAQFKKTDVPQANTGGQIHRRQTSQIKGIFIQVGAFSVNSHAIKMAISAGREVSTPINIYFDRYHKVVVGPYSSRLAAQKDAEKLRSVGFSLFITQR